MCLTLYFCEFFNINFEYFFSFYFIFSDYNFSLYKLFLLNIKKYFFNKINCISNVKI